MIRIRAKIRLNHVRKTPFGDGYFPLFNFDSESKVGGKIFLIDRNEFAPGETGTVEIRFPEGAEQYLGESFSVGTTFTFDEGTPTSIGDGTVEAILETETPLVP